MYQMKFNIFENDNSLQNMCEYCIFCSRPDRLFRWCSGCGPAWLFWSNRLRIFSVQIPIKMKMNEWGHSVWCICRNVPSPEGYTSHKVLRRVLEVVKGFFCRSNLSPPNFSGFIFPRPKLSSNVPGVIMVLSNKSVKRQPAKWLIDRPGDQAITALLADGFEKGTYDYGHGLPDIWFFLVSFILGSYSPSVFKPDQKFIRNQKDWSERLLEIRASDITTYVQAHCRKVLHIFV